MPLKGVHGVLDTAVLGAFVLVTLGILVVPGPDVLYVMARSLAQGRRAGLFSVIGIGAGVLVHTILAAVGLSELFRLVPAAYHVVKYAGVAYLVYLAIRILRERPSDRLAQATPTEAPARLVGQAFLTNLLNPKAALFFVALLPQFTTAPAGEPLFLQMLALGLVVVVLSLLVNLAYALLAARVAAAFRRDRRAENVRRWVSATTLGIIALLAVRATLPADS